MTWLQWLEQIAQSIKKKRPQTQVRFVLQRPTEGRRQCILRMDLPDGRRAEATLRANESDHWWKRTPPGMVAEKLLRAVDKDGIQFQDDNASEDDSDERMVRQAGPGLLGMRIPGSIEIDVQWPSGEGRGSVSDTTGLSALLNFPDDWAGDTRLNPPRRTRTGLPIGTVPAIEDILEEGDYPKGDARRGWLDTRHWPLIEGPYGALSADPSMQQETWWHNGGIEMLLPRIENLEGRLRNGPNDLQAWPTLPMNRGKWQMTLREYLGDQWPVEDEGYNQPIFPATNVSPLSWRSAITGGGGAGAGQSGGVLGLMPTEALPVYSSRLLGYILKRGSPVALWDPETWQYQGLAIVTAVHNDGAWVKRRMGEQGVEFRDVHTIGPALWPRIVRRDATIEKSAQSLWNLELPLPADLTWANTERIWRYDIGGSDLWYGDPWDFLFESGGWDPIKDQPRYNPEYHEGGIYSIYWEPYLEPVTWADLMQDITGGHPAFFYIFGTYPPYNMNRGETIDWEGI